MDYSLREVQSKHKEIGVRDKEIIPTVSKDTARDIAVHDHVAMAETALVIRPHRQPAPVCSQIFPHQDTAKLLEP